MLYQLPSAPGIISGGAKIPNHCVTQWHEDTANLCSMSDRNWVGGFYSSTAHLLLTGSLPHLHCPRVPSPKMSSITVATKPLMTCPILKDWVLLTTVIPGPAPYSMIYLDYSWTCWFICVFYLPSEMSFYEGRNIFLPFIIIIFYLPHS